MDAEEASSWRALRAHSHTDCQTSPAEELGGPTVAFLSPVVMLPPVLALVFAPSSAP